MNEDIQNILDQIQSSGAGIEDIQAALEKQKEAGIAYDTEGRTAVLQAFDASLTEQGLAETFVRLIDGTLRYVNEQREEEALMRNVLDRINLIGDGPQSLYFIDKEMEALNQQAEAAEAAE